MQNLKILLWQYSTSPDSVWAMWLTQMSPRNAGTEKWGVTHKCLITLPFLKKVTIVTRHYSWLHVPFAEILEIGLVNDSIMEEYDYLEHSNL